MGAENRWLWETGTLAPHQLRGKMTKVQTEKKKGGTEDETGKGGGRGPVVIHGTKKKIS